MIKHFIIVVLVFSLCACARYTEQDATRVCGVPVKGTPCELASTLASQREGGFVPELQALRE